MNSALASLNSRDFWNGILMAVLTPVVGYAMQILDGGTLVFDWNKILTLAVSGFVGYIAKKYMSDSNGNFLGIGSPKP